MGARGREIRIRVWGLEGVYDRGLGARGGL